MAPAVVNLALQACFYAQLILHGFGFELHLLVDLIRSVQARRDPDYGHLRGIHLPGQAIGKSSWHLAIALSLYLLWPGQSMRWYKTVFGYVASKEAILALLDFSSVLGVTPPDWYWCFGQYTWFYGNNLLREMRYFFNAPTQAAINEAQTAGLVTTWVGLQPYQNIRTRVLSIAMDIPQPDPALLGHSILTLKLRVASTTPFRVFANIIPSHGCRIYDDLHTLIVKHIASPSFSWELMWVYAPRDVAYISRVEWEKLRWLGAMLLEKMVGDAIWFTCISLDTHKLRALTTILTSKETLAALLDSASYYGPETNDLPTLEMARTHFLVLSALSYLTFVENANDDFVDWFMGIFYPLVDLLDQEYEEENVRCSSLGLISAPKPLSDCAPGFGLPGGGHISGFLDKHRVCRAGASHSKCTWSCILARLRKSRDTQANPSLGETTSIIKPLRLIPIVRPPSFLERLLRVRSLSNLFSLFNSSSTPDEVANRESTAITEDNSSKAHNSCDSEVGSIRRPLKPYTGPFGTVKPEPKTKGKTKGGISKARKPRRARR